LIVLGVGDVGWLGFGFDENLGDVERERGNRKDASRPCFIYHSDGL